MSEAKKEYYKNHDGYWKGKKRPEMQGENHPFWIEDRSQLKKQDRRNDSAYKAWRKKVFEKDNYQCKINNEDCSGNIEAHYILSWSTHPELRYSVNNGITLCHAHHPQVRAKEKRLIPLFEILVSVSRD